MPPRFIALAIACAAIAIAFFVVQPKRTPGPALRDFEAYYAAGATWRYHGDAYGRDVWRVEKTVPGVVATRDELLPFVGPPYGLPLWELLARLPWREASALWGLGMALALSTIGLCCLRLAGAPFERADTFAVLVLCLAFGPLTGGVALGQVAIVSCAAIFAMPALLRPRLGLAALGCALAAGLQPNLAVVLVARLAGARTWFALAGAALVASLSSMLVLGGPDGLLKYFDVLRKHAVAEKFIAIQTTTGAVARGFGAAPVFAGGIATGIALTTLVVLALQCSRGRYAPNDRLALACAAWPLALPFGHEHDFTLAFLPIVVVLRRARGAYAVLGALAALCIAVDWLGLAQRPAGLWTTTLLALAAALALAALTRERLQPRHAIPTLAVLAVYCIGAFAGTHRLPIWPDALPGNFHIALTATAADVWRSEQERSGIAAVDPWWSLLRLIPLAGCGVLWFVASVALRTPSTVPAKAPRSERSSTAHRPQPATCPSA
ncbi:MAG: DUF2029 domain-containing protein [Candidatus Eremiobacteraeota bacterium]|nr:DUF2029 domain-containing protein [Candidatus Eremiobacteraeota bacterium]